MADGRRASLSVPAETLPASRLETFAPENVGVFVHDGAPPLPQSTTLAPGAATKPVAPAPVWTGSWLAAPPERLVDVVAELAEAAVTLVRPAPLPKKPPAVVMDVPE